ncbi:Protein of unknown function, partial [Gryllus bimaculatus]
MKKRVFSLETVVVNKGSHDGRHAQSPLERRRLVTSHKTQQADRPGEPACTSLAANPCEEALPSLPSLKRAICPRPPRAAEASSRRRRPERPCSRYVRGGVGGVAGESASAWLAAPRGS